MQIRELSHGDLNAVAALFLTVFRDLKGATSRELADYFGTIYLRHPWQQPGMGSLVAVTDNGSIEAFIGVLPVRMVWNGTIATASVCTSLMVDPNATSKIAGAQILRAYLRRDHWLAFTENASSVSEAMWRRLKGEVLGIESLGFRLVLRPAEFSIGESRKRLPLFVFGVLKLCLPLLRLLINRNRPTLAFSDERSWSIREATDAELLSAIPPLVSDLPLRPAWDDASLSWLLKRAAERRGNGRLRRILVTDIKDEIIGVALYYFTPAEAAEILDIFYKPERLEIVLDAVITDIYKQGSCRLEGRLRQALLLPLGRRGATFRVGSTSLVNSSDPDVMALALRGNVPLGGLAGEVWSRLICDDFPLDGAASTTSVPLARTTESQS